MRPCGWTSLSTHIERLECLGKHVGRHAGGSLFTAATRRRCYDDGDRPISGRLLDGGILAGGDGRCRQQDDEGQEEEARV
jgi:hypothetical protein